jgi:hypothetical protein
MTTEGFPVITVDLRQGQKFPLGQVVITANALGTLPPNDVPKALARHAAGDWGDLDEEDRHQNELALEHRLRIFSAYRAADGTRFWVITEADRSATTVLLPADY